MTDPFIQKFKEDLEETLDEQFPKQYEEGPKKTATRRGAGLVLFSQAVLLCKQALQDHKKHLAGEVEGMEDKTILGGILGPQDYQRGFSFGKQEGWNAAVKRILDLLSTKEE